MRARGFWTDQDQRGRGVRRFALVATVAVLLIGAAIAIAARGRILQTHNSRVQDWYTGHLDAIGEACTVYGFDRLRPVACDGVLILEMHGDGDAEGLRQRLGELGASRSVHLTRDAEALRARWRAEAGE